MRDIVAILPAAGVGSRLFPHGGCKELVHVGSNEVDVDGSPVRTPKAVVEYTMDAIVDAEVDRVVVVTTPRKLNLLSTHLCLTYAGRIDVAYVVGEPPSMAHSIALAGPWTRGTVVVLAMPDSLVYPRDAVRQLLGYHRTSGSEVSLGLFKTNAPSRFGMVHVGPDGAVLEHADKPVTWDGCQMWGLAVWNPTFNDFLQERLAHEPGALPAREPVLGDVFDAFIAAGGLIRGHEIVGGRYADIGTYDDYHHAVRSW